MEDLKTEVTVLILKEFTGIEISGRKKQKMKSNIKSVIKMDLAKICAKLKKKGQQTCINWQQFCLQRKKTLLLLSEIAIAPSKSSVISSESW